MNVGSRGRVVTVVATALAIGVAVGAFALAVGLEHNSQGEFIDTATGNVDIVYCALVFGTWFVLASFSTAAIAGLGYAMTKLLRRTH